MIARRWIRNLLKDFQKNFIYLCNKRVETDFQLWGIEESCSGRKIIKSEWWYSILNIVSNSFLSFLSFAWNYLLKTRSLFFSCNQPFFSRIKKCTVRSILIFTTDLTSHSHPVNWGNEWSLCVNTKMMKVGYLFAVIWIISLMIGNVFSPQWHLERT